MEEIIYNVITAAKVKRVTRACEGVQLCTNLMV